MRNGPPTLPEPIDERFRVALRDALEKVAELEAENVVLRAGMRVAYDRLGDADYDPEVGLIFEWEMIEDDGDGGGSEAARGYSDKFNAAVELCRKGGQP